MTPQLLRDYARCLAHDKNAADHKALIEILENLNGLHPSPIVTALVAEGLTRAYRIGRTDGLIMQDDLSP
jgi:hypothetical protein